MDVVAALVTNRVCGNSLRHVAASILNHLLDRGKRPLNVVDGGTGGRYHVPLVGWLIWDDHSLKRECHQISTYLVEPKLANHVLAQLLGCDAVESSELGDVEFATGVHKGVALALVKSREGPL